MEHIREGCIVAADNLVSCDLADETALLHFPSGIYYGLNPVGRYVWNLIQTPKSFDELRDAVVKEYDVERERCERDLLALLEELSAARLIDLR